MRNDSGNTDEPDGNVLASPEGTNLYSTAQSDGNMRTGSVVVDVKGETLMSGESLPVNNMQPSLALNPIICLFGIFPSRD